MKCHYLVQIENPTNHLVKVTMNLEYDGEAPVLQVFMPSWSPGSYLMREYSRNIRTIQAFSGSGSHLNLEQIDKGTYELKEISKDLKAGERFTIVYQVYCHELTVRTSHVDESHAFLHGPSFLMGIVGKDLFKPTLELRFPALWSKVATGLKEVSGRRSEFIFEAEDYDVLLDSPIEIGCHESNGFYVDGKPHGVNFYGSALPHNNDINKDIKTIVETVSGFWGEIPYDNYVFITHLVPNLYGGLEHLNSTALQFDGTRFHNKEEYQSFLELVSHEYFHTWNVKRIRPKELGPFDYRNENYTRMHWLTEGLTSFMDRFLVLEAGLITVDEYLNSLKKEISRYLSIPGRKFHSLEDSSFNTWIKLYRPDENSNNSSVSYYLKGALVFLTLFCDFFQGNHSFRKFILSLWERFKANPADGVTKDEVLDLLEQHSSSDIRERFDSYLSTTVDIDFDSHLRAIGVSINWSNDESPFLGIVPKFEGNRVFIASVIQDTCAFTGGLNAGDEIISVNKVRFLKKQFDDFKKIFQVGKSYEFHIIRNGVLESLNITLEKKGRTIETITVGDKVRAEDAFKNYLMTE